MGNRIAMSYYNNDTKNINKLRFDESLIKVLENIGLRPVGIYQPSNNAGLKWSVAYSDPEFRWSSTNLEIKQGRYSFANYATMFGRTHIKDSETGEYLNLNALDVGELRIGAGPAGDRVIETIAVPTGLARISLPIQGMFLAWNEDGEGFAAGTGEEVTLYARDAQLGYVELPGGLPR